MTRHFHREIEKLKKKILRLSSMVEDSMNQAVTAFYERNLDLARDVVDGDERIDEAEVDVEEECLKILALHQPVAIDLRYVVAVLKINNDLERIGDLAVNIAEIARALVEEDPMEMPGNLTPMVDETRKMLRLALDSLVNSDTAAARKVLDMDEEVDRLHRLTFRFVEDGVGKSPAAIRAMIYVLSLSRYLERIADHATNIAEDIIYMVEGDIVRHTAEEG